MKHKWIFCLLAILMMGSAQAWENPQYISPEDSVYWHANASCHVMFYTLSHHRVKVNRSFQVFYNFLQNRHYREHYKLQTKKMQ